MQSIEISNAEPPVYPNGDLVGVVEMLSPGTSGPAYCAELIRDALRAIHRATPPLSPSKRSTHRYAVPVLARAVAPHRAGHVSDVEAFAVLDHLLRSGLAAVEKVKLSRSAGRADVRDGLVLTAAGTKAADLEEATRA
jgi:hypothetical protein